MESYTGKGRGRVEGMDKATGRAVYAADYYEENMLHLADCPISVCPCQGFGYRYIEGA